MCSNIFPIVQYALFILESSQLAQKFPINPYCSIKLLHCFQRLLQKKKKKICLKYKVYYKIYTTKNKFIFRTFFSQIKIKMFSSRLYETEKIEPFLERHYFRLDLLIDTFQCLVPVRI